MQSVGGVEEPMWPGELEPCGVSCAMVGVEVFAARLVGVEDEGGAKKAARSRP
jgi:hypothetical protein